MSSSPYVRKGSISRGGCYLVDLAWVEVGEFFKYMDGSSLRYDFFLKCIMH